MKHVPADIVEALWDELWPSPEGCLRDYIASGTMTLERALDALVMHYGRAALEELVRDTIRNRMDG